MNILLSVACLAALSASISLTSFARQGSTEEVSTRPQQGGSPLESLELDMAERSAKAKKEILGFIQLAKDLATDARYYAEQMKGMPKEMYEKNRASTWRHFVRAGSQRHADCASTLDRMLFWAHVLSMKAVQDKEIDTQQRDQIIEKAQKTARKYRATADKTLKKLESTLEKI